MPTPTFTQDDLLLPPEELSQLHVALANLGSGDPLGTSVAEATNTVAMYTANYVLEEATWRRLMRPITIWQLYFLIGQVSDAVQRAKEAAMRELEGIRDGKFPLPLAGGSPATSAGGRWGGDGRISLR